MFGSGWDNEGCCSRCFGEGEGEGEEPADMSVSLSSKL